ncbi:MAG: ASCH domain-containing protein [Chitinophagales bacterium]|nr:ASCH domain-containing protein [Chitinophagales bacterium]
MLRFQYLQLIPIVTAISHESYITLAALGTLVVTGHKTIETRSWQTTYRGRILIHASKSKAGIIFCDKYPFTKYINNFSGLPFGAIIGEAAVTDIVKIPDCNYSDYFLNELSIEEKAFGDYTEGRFAWLFTDCKQFLKPIMMRGSLSIWECPLEIFNPDFKEM